MLRATRPRAGDMSGSGARRQARARARVSSEFTKPVPKVAGTTPIGDVKWRQRVRIAGRVHSVRVPTRTASANLECTLADGTGSILLVFQGRRQVPGLKQGARLVAEGMVGAWNGKPAMLNPDYELLAGAEVAGSAPSKP